LPGNWTAQFGKPCAHQSSSGRAVAVTYPLRYQLSLSEADDCIKEKKLPLASYLEMMKTAAEVRSFLSRGSNP